MDVHAMTTEQLRTADRTAYDKMQTADPEEVLRLIEEMVAIKDELEARGEVPDDDLDE